MPPRPPARSLTSKTRSTTKAMEMAACSDSAAAVRASSRMSRLTRNLLTGGHEPSGSHLLPSLSRCCRGRRRNREVPCGQAAFDGRHYRLGYLDPGPPLVLGFHQHPRCRRVIGPAEHLLHGRFVLRPLVTVAPVFRRQLPGLQRLALPCLEPPELFGRRHVQPELDYYHAFVGQRPLEINDLPVGAPPLFLGGEAFDPLDEDAAVPGPVQDRHSAPAGQRWPEPPQEVMPFL